MVVTLIDILVSITHNKRIYHTLEHTTKKCKGTGRAKGYGCGNESAFRTYGLCHESCYPKWLYSTPEGKERVERATLKATKDRRDLEKAAIRSKSERSLARELNATKNAVHKFVRERDEGLPCISCNAPYKSNFQAGHFMKAELYSTLKFDLDNIHGQCEQCNLREEGNLNGYDLRLPNRIGEERYRRLKERAANDKKARFKWDIEELKRIRKNLKK